jgi:GDPmannose 4,6-dehydratase
VAQIKLGYSRNLRLGNLNAQRDWGFAGDYVRAMWLMLQQEQPEDYVIGTGKTSRVEQFVETAFRHVGLDWRDYVTVDPCLYRPDNVDRLVADPSKAARRLGWEPEVTFGQLVEMMVRADLECLSGGAGIDAAPTPRMAA